MTFDLPQFVLGSSFTDSTCSRKIGGQGMKPTRSEEKCYYLARNETYDTRNACIYELQQPATQKEWKIVNFSQEL